MILLTLWPAKEEETVDFPILTILFLLRRINTWVFQFRLLAQAIKALYSQIFPLLFLFLVLFSRIFPGIVALLFFNPSLIPTLN